MGKLSEYISLKLNQKLKLEGIEYDKFSYGLDILLINISKMIVIFTLAIILGTVKETLIIFVCFALLRLHAFGIHANHSFVCTLISTVTHVLIPLFTRQLHIPTSIIMGMYAVLIICMFCFAPADTESHPLVGKELRRKLKIKSTVTILVLTAVGLILNNNRLMMLILFSEFYAVVGIVPITYTIFQRRKRNYEQYEE